jgi:hypothetical protein
MQILKNLLTVLFASSVIATIGVPPDLAAQNFVEYPNHPRTYGDHVVPTEWTGGPSEVSLVLETDESILHADGIGQAQRTARNTQNFVDDGTPQNFDNLDVIDIYGPRLPLLQQLSANGTTTLTYSFSTAVDQPLDLFIADVDSGDDVTVRAFDSANAPVDMTQWTLIGEGDLSLIKDTGTAMSSIVAPIPTTVFNSDGIRLNIIDTTNYNRSYSILRSPENADLSRIVIEFTGLFTSPSREFGSNGSHVYVALTTVPVTRGDVDLDGSVTFSDIPPFIEILIAGGFQAEADIDQNGEVNFQDIPPFIDVLIGA